MLITVYKGGISKTDLDIVREGDTDNQQFVYNTQQLCGREHAVLETRVEEVGVEVEHVVHVVHLCHVVLEGVPVGLDHLKHHVVLKVLHKVQHALSQGEGSRVPPSAREVEDLCLFVDHPNTGRKIRG